MWSCAPNEMIHWWHADTHRHSKFMPWKTLCKCKDTDCRFTHMRACVCGHRYAHMYSGYNSVRILMHIYIISSVAGRKDTAGHWADFNCNSPSVERAHPRAVRGVDRPFHFVHHPTLYRTDDFFFHNGTVWLSSKWDTPVETSRATTRC